MPDGLQTPTQISRALKEYGDMLARMLVASSMPDDEKRAWAAIVPKMTIEQLATFEQGLARYLDQAVADEFASDLTALREVLDTYEAEQRAAEKDLYSGLASVMDDIHAAEEAAKNA